MVFIDALFHVISLLRRTDFSKLCDIYWCTIPCCPITT